MPNVVHRGLARRATRVVSSPDTVIRDAEAEEAEAVGEKNGRCGVSVTEKTMTGSSSRNTPSIANAIRFWRRKVRRSRRKMTQKQLSKTTKKRVLYHSATGRPSSSSGSGVERRL